MDTPFHSNDFAGAEITLNASAKFCMFWYLVLLAFFGFCAWRKYRFQARPLLLSPLIFPSLVLALSVLFTTLLGAMLIPFAAELAVGLVISFVHPIFAASFFLATFLIKPWELLPRSELMEILPRCLAALAFCSLLVHLAGARNTRVVFNWGLLLFVGFFSWTFVAAMFAYNSAEAIDQFSVAMMPILATFLLILNAASEKLDLEVIRGSLIIAVLTLSCIACVRTLWGYSLGSPIPRLEGEGQWANANDLAALMVLVTPLVAFPLIARSTSVLNRLLGVGLTGFLIFGIWLSQSRGALLALVLGTVLHVALNYKLRLRTIAALGLTILISIGLLLSIKRQASDLSGSNSMRFEYFLTGVRMLKSNPITGVGFGNYTNLYERYTTKFEEYGKRTAHSSWVLAMAETGLPGLVLLLGLFCFVLKRAASVRQQFPELLFAMVSYGICMSLLSHTYQLAPYVLFAWVLSARRLLSSYPSMSRESH